MFIYQIELKVVSSTGKYRISNFLSMVMGIYLPWESLVEGAARDESFPREV